MSSAVAIINSPFGQGRVRAFARVEELSPWRRDSAASEVPFLRSAAIISRVPVDKFRIHNAVLKFGFTYAVSSETTGLLYPFRTLVLKSSRYLKEYSE